MASGEQQGHVKGTPSLLPLAPEFRPADHQYYVDAISDAIKAGGAVRNIALTGGYGVGKSSVLREVASLHDKKTVEISLSTLGLSDGDGGGETTTTNRIQKEIVKQLLYRERPNKMRGSRFRRLSRFGFWRAAGVGLLGGAAAWLTFLLAGWTARLSTLFHADKLGLWFQLAMLVVLTAASVGALALSHNRIAIKGLKVANADIALASEDTTYFDQFLDEIIYFFDVTRAEVVIFEDIDRFDDPHIFETLRALNTLLNSSKQLSQDIRFVYAIKDSIFALLGAEHPGETLDPNPANAARLEAAPANRTKFFDLVVPVVPFITHRNARELVSALMREVDPTLSVDLLDLCARELPDMRLLKNIRNEFVVFREKVSIGQGNPLSADQLFAMIVYKNVYLEDFELVPSGKSQLDVVYDGSRRLVRSAVAALNREGSELSKKVSTLNSVGARSAELGTRLTGYLVRLARHLMLPGPPTPRITVAGVATDGSRFADPELWQRISASSQQDTFTVQYLNIGWQPGQLVVTKADLADALGDSLVASDWDSEDRDRIIRRLEQIAADRGLLLHASYQDLIHRNDLSSAYEGGFTALLDREIGDRGIARDLIEAGFIDQNFALYASNYYADRVSVQALNFLLHNIDRNEMDVDYVLSTADVQAILDERGDGILRERCALNVSLLDVLLRTNDERASVLLENASSLGADALSFWSAYLAAGEQVDRAIAELAGTWAGIMTFLVGRDDLTDESKARLVDLALAHVSVDVDYAVDDSVRTFLRSAGSFAALTIGPSPERAEAVAHVLSLAGVEIVDLASLPARARDAVVNVGAWELSRANLVSATGGSQFALDQLRDAHRVVYDHAIANIELYLAALTEDDPTLVGTSEAAEVLRALAAQDLEALEASISRAGGSFTVEELSSVTPEAWGALADRDLFPATYPNVHSYIEAFGGIDARLGGSLARRGTVSELDGLEQDLKIALAVKIVGARASIPNPRVRVSLVEGFDLDTQLTPNQVTPEDGPLAALLIKGELLEDNEAAYALVTGRGWDTVGPYLAVSKAFAGFMSPTNLPVGLLPEFLTDPSIADELKGRVLDDLGAYTPTDDEAALRAVGAYAAKSRRRLSQAELLRINAAGVSPELTTDLLSLAITGMTSDEIRIVAEAIGGAIRSLFARDGKRTKLKDTPANRAIVERLKELDEVSSFKGAKGEIEVNLKPEN